MKVRSSKATTLSVDLSSDENFVVDLADGTSLRVDGVTAFQPSEGQPWDVKLHGYRVLKSGALGRRLLAGTWKHSRAFGQAAQVRLWLALPERVRDELAQGWGVTVND